MSSSTASHMPLLIQVPKFPFTSHIKVGGLKQLFSSLSLFHLCSSSSARYAVNRSISFAWASLSALSRSSLRTGVVDDADSARPVGASTRKLK